MYSSGRCNQPCGVVGASRPANRSSLGREYLSMIVFDSPGEPEFAESSCLFTCVSMWGCAASCATNRSSSAQSDSDRRKPSADSRRISVLIMYQCLNKKPEKQRSLVGLPSIRLNPLRGLTDE